MSPEHDDPSEEHELYEEVPPRSIFAATWFRMVLVVIVLGVIGAVAVPYVLDWMNPPVARAPVTAKSSPPPAVTPTPASPTEKPAAPTEKKDTTLIPAPVMPSAPTPAPAVPARPQPKSESKPTASTAHPVEAKPTPPKTEARAAAPSTESKSAMAVTEKPKPDVAAKPESPANTDTAAKTDTATKPSSAATDEAKPATAAKSTSTATRAVAKATTPPAAASGPFWVQVGAFRDAETAKRVAAKLREGNFAVEESVTRVGGSAPARSAPKPSAAKPPATAPDQYDVYITGLTADELNKRLMGKGLAVEQSGAGMVVKPSLPLRDAVALSKDLAVEGFNVKVKRAAGAAPPSAAAAPSALAPTEGGGTELHRVRVGAFPDRATAQAAVRDLEAKGYKPYIARGGQ